MKFEFKNGLIWISVALVYEGAPVEIDDCIIDTGSSTTAFDIDLIQFNYKKPAFIKRLYGLSGSTQEVISQKIDKLIIARNEIQEIEIEFGDIKSGININGFIGNDILSRFKIRIDYSIKDIEFIYFIP